MDPPHDEGPRVTLTRREAEDFLYAEARLLDGQRLEEWLELFAPEGIYWVPIDEDTDPERSPSIIYDDAVQRSKRVYQLLQGPRYAQVPPSRTLHQISNVEVEETDSEGEVSVWCNTVVFELRPGDHQGLQVALGTQRALVGRCQYRLRQASGRWMIVLKKVLLIDRDLPLSNLTFIL